MSTYLLLPIPINLCIISADPGAGYRPCLSVTLLLKKLFISLAPGFQFKLLKMYLGCLRPRHTDQEMGHLPGRRPLGRHGRKVYHLERGRDRLLREAGKGEEHGRRFGDPAQPRPLCRQVEEHARHRQVMDASRLADLLRSK